MTLENGRPLILSYAGILAHGSHDKESNMKRLAYPRKAVNTTKISLGDYALSNTKEAWACSQIVLITAF